MLQGQWNPDNTSLRRWNPDNVPHSQMTVHSTNENSDICFHSADEIQTLVFTAPVKSRLLFSHCHWNLDYSLQYKWNSQHVSQCQWFPEYCLQYYAAVEIHTTFHSGSRIRIVCKPFPSHFGIRHCPVWSCTGHRFVKDTLLCGVEHHAEELDTVVLLNRI